MDQMLKIGLPGLGSAARTIRWHRQSLHRAMW